MKPFLSWTTRKTLRQRLPLALGAAVGWTVILSGANAATPAYRWVDQPGQHRDLFVGDRPVLRYVYESLDTSSAADRERTYKPFHHVYDFTGTGFLTKGPGGRFSHHRGIFYGFSRNTYTRPDRSSGRADTWHASGQAFQEHIEFLEQHADVRGARLRTAISWHGERGEQFARENRELAVRHDELGRLWIDFQSTLTTEFPHVICDGDAQHAGFQFRAHNEVADTTSAQTYYLRPDGIAQKGDTRNPANNPSPDRAEDAECMNEPFKGMSFLVGGERYTVAYLDHPGNPKPTWYSERDYGRFGSYFVASLTPDQPLSVRYRLVILKGELSWEQIARLATDFAAESSSPELDQ